MDQPVYAAIVQALLEDGHHVPTAILASPRILDMEMVVDPREVYRRDVNWVQACDALIAEVSTPSHGVGYEIALALMLEKPVLACYRAGAAVSKMILGNDHPRFKIGMYRGAAEAVIFMRDFLRGL